MFKANSEHKLTAKHYDAMVRHQVRNLRVKVKNLLPHHICDRYSTRDKNIADIEFRRKTM